MSEFAGDTTQREGMTQRQARTIEYSLIALALFTLIAIFQPFSKELSAVGMSLVVAAGLLFNLVPLCTPGRPMRDLLRSLLIIIVIFVVVLALALSSAILYGRYLHGQ
ncbi:MAG: hypothetical protein AAFY56_17575 [Pseudomonadota bacterium]